MSTISGLTMLQWGILGTANIATWQMIPAIQQSESGRVVAIASRSSKKSAQVASQFGIDRSYGSYEELLADSKVDAIYIPLPNAMHCEWSTKAVEAGKCVLCEKPLGVTPGECRQMIRAAAQNNVFLMEGFWYRYHPRHQVVRGILAEGRLGDIRIIRAHLNGQVDLVGNVRSSRELAGGTLMDGGCYPVNLCRWLYQREPQRVSAFFKFDPTYKVDVSFSGLLDFGNGQHGLVESCFQKGPRSNRYEVVGDRGYLVVEPFLTTDHGSTTIRFMIDGQKSERHFGPINSFTLQADAFSTCVREGTTPLTPAEDAVKNMAVIQALYQSGHSSQHVPVVENS